MAIYDEFLFRPSSKIGKKINNWISASNLNALLNSAPIVPEHSDFLEIGSGDGYLGKYAISLGFRSYTGIEPNSILANYCRETHNLKIIEDSLPKLMSIKDNSYDVVFSAHVLEHAQSYVEARAWCQEMLRVLKHDGYVVVIAPDLHDYKSWFWDADWTHGFPTTANRVNQVFNDLNAESYYKGKLHLGRTGVASAIFAHLASAIIPTKLGDRIALRMFGKPLFSNIKIVFLGLTFVISKKK